MENGYLVQRDRNNKGVKEYWGHFGEDVYGWRHDREKAMIFSSFKQIRAVFPYGDFNRLLSVIDLEKERILSKGW